MDKKVTSNEQNITNNEKLAKSLALFLSYLHFCLEFFSHVGKRLDKKAKANLKIYGVRRLGSK